MLFLWYCNEAYKCLHVVVLEPLAGYVVIKLC